MANGFDMASLRFQVPVCTLWVAGALACLGFAWRDVDRDRSGRWRWVTVALYQVLLAIELPANLRWAVSDVFRTQFGFLKQTNGPVNHRVFQALAIALVVATFVAACVFLLIRSRRLSWPAKSVWAGLGISSLGFVIGAISLHGLDQYGFVYGQLVVAGVALSTAGWVAEAWGRREHVDDPSGRGVLGALIRLAVLVALLLLPEVVAALSGKSPFTDGERNGRDRRNGGGERGVESRPRVHAAGAFGSGDGETSPPPASQVSILARSRGNSTGLMS